jgi:hypothetical protein
MRLVVVNRRFSLSKAELRSLYLPPRSYLSMTCLLAVERCIVTM